MTSLSVAVMAHQKRAHYVEGLVDALGIDEDRVVWDRMDNRWDTGRRAMMHHDPEADRHMVIQDDAIVCRDLIAGLEIALDYVPRETIVSPFMGTRRPMRQRLERATKDADRQGASWIVMNPLNWGLAIIVPTHTIPAMVEWCDGEDYPNYDKRVGRYYWRQHQWPTWCTWPNLVEHRGGVSLCGHSEGRTAYQFVGSEASALDLDWTAGKVDIRNGAAPAPRGRPRQTRRRSGWTPSRPPRPIVK